MYWKLALIQHPMFLIIKEDTQCAERTPPWGAPSLELYIERVRDNLQRIRKYPQIRIGFEWSALEVEMLAQEAPDVFHEMCALAKEGRVAFYNGTYAQPHLQILSSEANIRQFEFGMRIYRELCDYPVITYAHQETSIHDQSPQIMKAFGLKYSALPQFPSTVHWIDGGEVVTRMTHPQFIQGQEFVRWVGLDGTELPLYLSPIVEDVNEWVDGQTMYGLMHEPPIMLEIPDLVEVDDLWLSKRERAEMVLIDQAFPERIKSSPPQARVRHFTYWSYIEGIRAEELSRSNWMAEATTLRAESLNAMAFTLLNRPATSTDPIWKTILKTQHHDVYCFCAPELKGKAIGWLQEATQAAQNVATHAAEAVTTQVDTTQHDGMPVVVFNTIPHAQKGVVSLEVDQQNPVVINAKGERIPAEIRTMDGNKSLVRFIEQSPGWGYNTYWLKTGSTPDHVTEVTEPIVFENSFYRATIQPDGTFSSLLVKPSGAELLATGSIAGNQLLATDTTGIGPQINPGRDNMPRWETPKSGHELSLQSAVTASVRKSPLGMVVIVNGTMGEKVKATITINFYNDLQRIDLVYTFNFDTASIGSFYLDETKLRVHWPLAFTGSIHHDIPFGVVKSQEGLPIHPTSWVDISDGKKGLAYYHKGTFKHWVKEGVLMNLFAWGEETNAIGSRMWRHNWSKSFDQRLKGHHTIETALYPHNGDWHEAGIPVAAQSFSNPPFGYITEQHNGILPSSMKLMSITEPEIASTVVKIEDEKLFCRLYSFANKVLPLKVDTEKLRVSSLRTLEGDDISDIKPFQIGTLTLAPF